MTRPGIALLSSLLLALGASACGEATTQTPVDAGPTGPTPPDGSCPGWSALKNPYFGDLHVHTAFSLDAYAAGTRNDPARAYSFGRGNAIKLAGGNTARLARPLDFMAVTDHSEFLGLLDQCTLPGKDGQLSTEKRCSDLRTIPQVTLEYLFELTDTMPSEFWCEGPDALPGCPQFRLDAWARLQAAAEAANDRCHFTAFKAFEWTGNPDQANIHRNIIFAGSATVDEPIDYVHYPTVGKLWSTLESKCTGECRALSIPHNANYSIGTMFNIEDPAQAAQRARYERVTEIFQHKGSSECLNTLDPRDEGYDPSCDFELAAIHMPRDAPAYVRAGLESGLLYHAANKIDPMELGFIGSTDTHNATPANVEEDVWPGHLGLQDGDPAARLTKAADWNPGGIAGLWAEENTRDSIFAALMRRETWATSGPRIVLRFYQYRGSADPCADATFPAAQEAGGVRMGGEMDSAADKPRFVVHALKDAHNLASVDLIKARVVGGKVVEKILKAAAQNPAVGEPTLCRTFVDDDWDPAAPSFYYARVLEVPSPRWSHYDCKADPADCAPGLDSMIQERAWSSPIFHLPR